MFNLNKREVEMKIFKSIVGLLMVMFIVVLAAGCCGPGVGLRATATLEAYPTMPIVHGNARVVPMRTLPPRNSVRHHYVRSRSYGGYQHSEQYYYAPEQGYRYSSERSYFR